MIPENQSCQFELDLVTGRKPTELLRYWSDVIKSTGVCNHSSQLIWGSLQLSGVRCRHIAWRWRNRSRSRQVRRRWSLTYQISTMNRCGRKSECDMCRVADDRNVCLKVKCESRITPRILTLSLNGIVDPNHVLRA